MTAQAKFVPIAQPKKDSVPEADKSGTRLKEGVERPWDAPTALRFDVRSLAPEPISLMPEASPPPLPPRAPAQPAKREWVMPNIEDVETNVDDDELARLERDGRRRRKTRFMVALAFPLVIVGVLFALGGDAPPEIAQPMLTAAINAGEGVKHKIKREKYEIEQVEKEIAAQVKLDAAKEKLLMADRKKKARRPRRR